MATADSHDVVIAGGGLIGSAAAYFLSEHRGFDGSIVVLEPDPTYARAASSLSAASLREQFSHPVNIQASQFAMSFLTEFHTRVEVDGDAPDLGFVGTGYLFLADRSGIDRLGALNAFQRTHGVQAEILTPAELGAAFPYLAVEELGGGALGSRREGTLDAWALLHGLRQRARANGVTYVPDAVDDLTRSEDRIESVVTRSGRTIRCRWFINATGTRAALIARLAGLAIPVEPRKRSVFVFDSRTPLGGRVPLTIFPSGVYFRADQNHFLAGATPPDDPAVDPDDFEVQDELFEDLIWPELVRYVPRFDRIKLVASWAGHYAYNPVDQNMIVGPDPEVANYLHANGFSGHGLQHAPAVGRALSELVVDGRYRTIDMTSLGMARLHQGRADTETNVI